MSGAGAIRRLPLLRTGLCVITAIYLLRALAILPLAVVTREEVSAFGWWSSAICLGYGLVHLVGLAQVWRRLSMPPAAAAHVPLEAGR